MRDGMAKKLKNVTNDGVEIPGDVLSFAESVNGVPIAWRYGELSVTVVMEDGRKLRFERAEVGDVFVVHPDPITGRERAVVPPAPSAAGDVEPVRKAFVSAQRESMERARRSKSHAGKE